MRKFFLFTFLTTGLVITGQSQNITPAMTPATTNAGGGTYNAPGSYFRYFDWSIGELSLITTERSADGLVTVYQGVLQPCTEKPGNSPLTSDFESTDFKIFPNPTIGKFEIDFFVRANGTLYLDLTNTLGQVMERRNFRYYGCCQVQQYDISQLPAGVYFITATLVPDGVSPSNSNTLYKRSGIKVVKLR